MGADVDKTGALMSVMCPLFFLLSPHDLKSKLFIFSDWSMEDSYTNRQATFYWVNKQLRSQSASSFWVLREQGLLHDKQ